MGIRGLLGHCLRRRDECAEEVDLVAVAKSRGGIEILVDFYSFEHMLLPKFWKGLSSLRNNEYLRILGGEYGSMDNFIRRFVEIFRQLKISFVFFLDATKGCSDANTQHKLDTWMKRHHREVSNLNEVINVCRGTKEMFDLEEQMFIRPVCLEIQIVETLKSCGCELIQSVTGEADFMIAKALHEREKAFVIWSNDSDFCIFKNCRFIPNELFDFLNSLQLGLPIEVPVKPESVMCGIISTERVMNTFGFQSHHLMTELSIIAGNDFTSQYVVDGLNEQLDLRGRKSVETFAEWVNRYKAIENHPMLSREMSHNFAFARSVEHSRLFYCLQASPEEVVHKGYFSKLLAEKITLLKYPTHLMAMHNNFYWHRMLQEDTTYGQPCVEVALADLRSHVYRSVLPRQENLVNEYGRSPWEPLRIAGILAIDDPEIPPVHKIHEDKIFWNLNSFHHIMSHLEPVVRTKWFDRYGRKNGFIVYCLRYFLLLTWGQNLQVTQQEFLALCALVFARPREEHYQQIRLRPTPRCVTMGNWFLDIYRHAYHFLGKLLFLSHEFPLPAEIFCGSAWTCFYMSCKDDTYYSASTQTTPEVLCWIQDQMNAVISDKRHMIKHITEGVFEFNDRF
ncbi:uncharacterized protein LOC133205770 [Saccostrea echinata]|uniref:uncharacterized protein LOC133205770 n=1 Tax=Saccostrea echinata TaxID=191078 RepID=UPI002A80F854|nr:uncharacterized protein LOC133205770 [Saccostrea echinata]